MAAASVDLSQHTVPLDTPTSRLEAAQSFQGLAEREKLYCHYLSRAAWEGSYICLLQTSPESVPIFVLLRELFARQSIASLREVVKDLLTEDEFTVRWRKKCHGNITSPLQCSSRSRVIFPIFDTICC